MTSLFSVTEKTTHNEQAAPELLKFSCVSQAGWHHKTQSQHCATELGTSTSLFLLRFPKGMLRDKKTTNTSNETVNWYIMPSPFKTTFLLQYLCNFVHF